MFQHQKQNWIGNIVCTTKSLKNSYKYITRRIHDSLFKELLGMVALKPCTSFLKGLCTMDLEEAMVSCIFLFQVSFISVSVMMVTIVSLSDDYLSVMSSPCNASRSFSRGPHSSSSASLCPEVGSYFSLRHVPYGSANPPYSVKPIAHLISHLLSLLSSPIVQAR